MNYKTESFFVIVCRSMRWEDGKHSRQRANVIWNYVVQDAVKWDITKQQTCIILKTTYYMHTELSDSIMKIRWAH